MSSYRSLKKRLGINGTYPVVRKIVEQLEGAAENKSRKKMMKEI